MHWTLLARARSVDNGIYTAVCSPARDMSGTYHAYGHSLVSDPNGDIIVEAGEKEEIVYADIDPARMESGMIKNKINKIIYIYIYKMKK